MYLTHKAKSIFNSIDPYFRLMRLHQPIGIWLVLWPGIWAISLASPELPDIKLIIIFILGSISMRAAGCIINDIADRDFDKHVERTKYRPLASGELSIKQALVALSILLLISLLLLLTLNHITIIVGLLSIIPIIIYPLMKRVTYWPQAFLGITFNWGALMGWTAVTGKITIPTFFLYLACICWTLGYDTIYAHQDKNCDQKIGVKSTALALGNNTKTWLGKFYKWQLIFLFVSGQLQTLGPGFALGFIFMTMHLYWQVKTLDLDNPNDCRDKFISNIGFGWIVLGAIIAGKIYVYPHY